MNVSHLLQRATGERFIARTSSLVLIVVLRMSGALLLPSSEVAVAAHVTLRVWPRIRAHPSLGSPSLS